MKRIFVAINSAGQAGRSKLVGIYRHIINGTNSRMTVLRHPAVFTASAARKAAASHYDGFIISTGESEDAQRILAELNTPTVLLDISDESLWKHRDNVFFIRNSGDTIGSAGADYLVGTGRCHSYAYIHFRTDERTYEWDRRRYLSFRNRLKAKGLVCHDLHSPDEIDRLARPIGILAANDEVAYETIQHCRERRIRVPESALVIGVDNDTLICENSSPQITSIFPDFEKEGQLAAEALEQMMSGKRASFGKNRKSICVGVKEIVCRGSTVMVSHSGRMVQKAVAIIKAKATNGISVDDVVAEMGCSRRLADLRFRELMNMSIGQMIINTKLDEVRRRLLSSNDSFASIASSVGYVNLAHLGTLFKRRFKQSMQRCRNSHARA